MVTKVARSKAPASILQLHIELRGTKPKIWRRILVPETITLAKLHLVIQAAFGWGHSHLHEFIAGDGERYGTDSELRPRHGRRRRRGQHRQLPQSSERQSGQCRRRDVRRRMRHVNGHGRRQLR